MANMIPNSVDDGFEMPSLNIRNSIADKVAAKKTAKGYKLSDERCDVCEMHLMTLKGKSECKVCPAIKKWVARKNEKNGAGARVDEEDARATTEILEQIRDAAPSYSIDMDEKSTDEIEAVDSDEKSEFETPPHDDSESVAEGSDDVKLSVTASTDSACYSYDDDGRYLSKSFTEESEDTEAIRARARQIILDARNGGNSWGSGSDDDSDDDDDDDSAKSSSVSWEHTFAKELVEERAGEIINQARKNLQEEHGLEFPTDVNTSPRSDDVENQLSGIGSYDVCRSSSVDENCDKEESSAGVGLNEAANSHTIDESSKKAAAIIDSYSSKVEERAEEVRVEEDVNSRMGSDEATVIIQSVARRYLAVGLLYRMMYRKSQQDEEEEKAVEEGNKRKSALGVNAPAEEGNEEWENISVQGEGPSPDDIEEPHDEDCRNDVQEKPELTQGSSHDFVQGGAQGDVQGASQDQNGAEDAAHHRDQDVEGEVEVRSESNQYNADTSLVAQNPSLVGRNPCTAAVEGSELITVEPHEFNNGVVFQQQEVVPMSDYAAVLQKHPVAQKETEDAAPPSDDAKPSRGLFAMFACKFDDAVNDAIGKVHSIVTCNMSQEDNGFAAGGFGEAFEAEQNDLIARSYHCGQVQHYGHAAPVYPGQVPYGAQGPSSGQSKFDTQLMLLSMNGWMISNSGCDRCNKVLMILPESGQMMCAGCDDIQGGPGPMMMPPHLQQVINQAPPPVMNAAPSREHFAHFAPPRPGSTVNYAHMASNVPQPGVMHAASGHEYFSGHAPPRSESVANRAHLLHNNSMRQEPAASHAPPRPESVVNHAGFIANPSTPSHLYPNYGQPGPAIATPSRQQFTGYTPHGSFQSNVQQNTNTNPLRDVTAAHYGPTADQAKSTVEPAAIPKPTNQPPSKAVSSKPPRPSSTTARNAHNQVMMQNARNQITMQKPLTPSQIMMQNTITPTQVQMMQNARNQRNMQNVHNQRMEKTDAPSQLQMMQETRNRMAQVQLTPSQNQMMQMPPRDQFSQDDDAKENAFGGANTANQLDKTKLRIDDAKKFIMSRSNHRAMPPSMGMPPLMNNMTPGGHLTSQMIVQGSGNPQIKNTNPAAAAQAGIFRPPVATPGAAQAGTPQALRQMGSLMSPREGSNCAAQQKNATITTQMSNGAHPQVNVVTAGDAAAPQDDGYATPEMPGRYFFA